ncbi:MAG: hypothetical protein KC912_19265 [Proteobacteria bacterium]|nr:hypothetical protein [Pseudomonadota bacterium]
MLILLASLALGADLVVHTTVPIELRLDGHVKAQLFSESEVRLPVDLGSHAVTIYRNGTPENFDIVVRKGLDATLTVGKAGVTLGEALERLPPVEGSVPVEFRVADDEGVLLFIGDERHPLTAGSVFTTELPAGETTMSVRSETGTTIWASGVLAIESGPIVVQLNAGRLPEVPSLGGSFQPKRR